MHRIRGTFEPGQGEHRPWPVRRLFPLLATVGLIVIGLAGTIWGPRFYGKSDWAVPDDLWGTLIAAHRFIHLDLGGLYTAPTNLISFPGTAVILIPAAAVIDVAGLPLHAGHQGPHPYEWLFIGSYETAISAVALFAADAIAERLGASWPKRLLLAAAGATAMWSVSVRWGHPEDAVAVGLLLYAILALPGPRPHRAAWLAPWLAGAAVAVQPLVLLAFPVLVAVIDRKRVTGFLVRAAVPAVGLLAAAAAANWPATISRVTSQPNAPAIDHPTPWIYLAPRLSDGSVAAGPGRSLAVVAALGCGVFLWHRVRSNPARLEELLWWVAVALALRSVFEPVMVAYYLWPPLAVALAAAAADWSRLLPAGAAAVVLTFFSQVLWRNPWAWWTPMITILVLVLAVARPRRVRSPAARARETASASRTRIADQVFYAPGVGEVAEEHDLTFADPEDLDGRCRE